MSEKLKAGTYSHYQAMSMIDPSVAETNGADIDSEEEADTMMDASAGIQDTP